MSPKPTNFLLFLQKPKIRGNFEKIMKISLFRDRQYGHRSTTSTRHGACGLPTARHCHGKRVPGPRTSPATAADPWTTPTRPIDTGTESTPSSHYWSKCEIFQDFSEKSHFFETLEIFCVWKFSILNPRNRIPSYVPKNP